MSSKVHYLKRTHSCPHCIFRKLLSSISRDNTQLCSLADRVTQFHGPYAAGEHIFRYGDPFRSLRVVQKGAVKTEILSPNGACDVTGFFLTGDVFGFDAIGQPTHGINAIALNETWICEFPFNELESLCHREPILQSQVFSLLGEVIRRESHELRLIRHQKAEQRVLWFLNDLYTRVALRKGHGLREIPLPMLKDDVARNLGLTRETLSRILKKLNRNGVIRNHVNRIEILDVDALNTAVGV